MKAHIIALAILAILTPFVSHAADEVLRDPVAEALRNLSKKEQAKLDAGKVIFVSRSEKDEDGADAGIGWAIGIVNAPPEKVWSVLEDFANYPDYMPRVSAIESYELPGNTEHFGLKFTLKILLSGMTYHIKQHNDAEAFTITWEKDQEKEDDFTQNNGQWILRPHGEGGTLAFYTVDIRTKRRIPQFLQDYLLKRDLPDVIDALKQEVESGGAYSKN